MPDLQQIGAKALQNAPQPLRRALDGLGIQFKQESSPASPMAGGLGPGNNSILAGVEKGSPNTISVLDPGTFRKNADQLVTHEGMHVWQNNLPPALQKMIPPDDPNNPYQVASPQKIAGILNRGGNILSLPKEQQSATMQYGQVHGMPEPYNALSHTMDDIPRSQIDMTDPMAKTINTHPRAPQVPPSSVPGMNFATTLYQPGAPPDISAPLPNVTFDPQPGSLGHKGDSAPLLARTLNTDQGPAPDTSAPLQKVSYAPSPAQRNLDYHQQQLEHFRAQDKGTPWDQRSTGSKIAHVLNVAAQTAGDIFAPNVMANIPGTELNRRVQEHNLSGEVDKESQDISEGNSRDAQTQRTNLENAALPGQQAQQKALNDANLAHVGAETYSLQHPKANNEFELWHQQNPTGTAEQYNQLMSKPLTPEDAQSRNAVWDSIADKYHLPKGQFRAGMSAADAGALATALNNVVSRDQGGQKIIIQGQNANNAAQKTRDAETNKEYNAAQKDLGAQFSAAQTQAETLATARQELSSGAVGQAVGTIKTLVGLAGGKGTGVRITQAELNALAHARGIKGSFEGYISGLEGKGNLAPEQLQGMQQLLTDVEGRIQQKLAMQDGYMDKLSNATTTQEIRQIQSDYRKEFLHPQQGGGGGQQEPPRPANVPEGYHFDAHGPKGAGWYR